MTESSLKRALQGHDFGPPITNALGTFYIVVALFYSFLVAVGLLYLWLYRHHPAVRIRNFAVICSSVLTIHIYLFIVLMVYPLNGAWKCGAEFWIMSTALPLGWGLFQASNVRLLSYYDAQQRIIETDGLLEKKRRLTWSPRFLWLWWKQQSLAMKTYVGIGVGFAVQILVTFILYFGSRRYHASYGFYYNHVGAAECRRGYDWIPSVIWQFLWSWFFGPIVLFRIRHIRDVHGWAWQTKIAIIASLPGTPLWLAFTYSNLPAIQSVNKYFVPPGWFLPGLFTLQFVSIYFPLLGVYRSRQPTHSFPRIPVKQKSLTSITSSAPSTQKNRDLYTMAALETQLERNIAPLLIWAAEKEFTAENIVFLRSVRDFKKKWDRMAKRSADSGCPMDHRELYEEAGLIFFTLVNPSTAKFNINIDSRTYAELSQKFAGLQYEPFDDDTSVSSESSRHRSVNEVTPWADSATELTALPESPRKFNNDVEKLYPLPVTEISAVEGDSKTSTTSVSFVDLGVKAVEVPVGFGVDVFDVAYESVKKDVFLNTWVKFLDAAEVESIA